MMLANLLTKWQVLIQTYIQQPKIEENKGAVIRDKTALLGIDR
jgi:hypothetical protein